MTARWTSTQLRAHQGRRLDEKAKRQPNRKKASTAKYIDKVCLNCGAGFRAYYYDHLKGMGNYCKMECFFEQKRKKIKEDGSRLDKNCKQCNKPFSVTRKEVEKGGGKFCSAPCASKYNTGENNVKHVDLVSLTCKECGVEYKVYPAWVRRSSFCSRRCSSINTYRDKNQLNNGVQRGHGGRREDLNNMYFRSSWEANYARYLNLLMSQGRIKKWEYEVDTFEFHRVKKGTRFYTPDFKVFSSDEEFEYHEVKGWIDEKSKTRARRMALYYPEIKIQMITKDWFRANGKALSAILPNWEKKY